MACEVKIWYMISTTLLLLNLGPFVHGESQVPCYFIFGDALVDNGNNNGLVTHAKANFPPYGVDFPDGPTGRFTNGRNKADIIAELLDFDSYIQPFATANGSDILKGVNYGSGAAGILDETGEQLGDRFSLNKQLLNHQVTISHIAVLLGNETSAKEYISKCIYTVGMGTNDYINYLTTQRYTPNQYATVLINQYSRQLKILYELGARKVAIFGLSLMGCTSAELAMNGTSGSASVNTINNEVQLFNDKLKPFVDELNNNLADAKFIYINTTSISLEDPSVLGNTNLKDPCCRVSTTIPNGLCIPGEIPCNKRAEYACWDSFHPSESVHMIIARRAYSALLPSDAYPIDIRRLAQL